jgi:hypothetical protein
MVIIQPCQAPSVRRRRYGERVAGAIARPAGRPLMNWNHTIRQAHRWVSILFTLGVITNMVVMSQLKPDEKPPMFVGMLAFIPLMLLLVSGLYMFAQPYFAKRRAARNAG